MVVIIFVNIFNSSEGFAELKNQSGFVTQCPIGIFSTRVGKHKPPLAQKLSPSQGRLREMRGWVPFGIACDLWREVVANCRVRRGSSGYTETVSAHHHMNNKHNNLILTPP